MADESLPPDASDEVLENNLRSEQARKAREDTKVVLDILSSRQGRAWWHRVMSMTNMLVSAHHGERTHDTSFALGMKEVGQWLFLEAQKASLDLYVQMIREAAEEEERQAKEVKKRNDRAAGKLDEPLTPAAQYPDLPAPPGWPGHSPANPPKE
jgi:hypothetical protein